MEFINHLGYNSVVILTFFFISLIALILNYITKGKSNNVLFSSYRSSLLKPLTYVRLVTHIFGHADWNHFMNNFLYILLILTPLFRLLLPHPYWDVFQSNRNQKQLN